MDDRTTDSRRSTRHSLARNRRFGISTNRWRTKSQSGKLAADVAHWRADSGCWLENPLPCAAADRSFMPTLSSERYLEPSRLHFWRSALVLVLIWAGIFLPSLGTLELKGEEGRRVLPGQTMLRNGDWIVPQVGGEPYLRKPPMINWLAAVSFKTTGVENEWTARLPSVLGVLMLVLVIYFAGIPWLGWHAAFAAAVFSMTNLAMIDKGRLLEIDALYSVVTGVAVILWLRSWMLDRPWLNWIFIGVALACGYLLKGPVHLLFFYAVVLAVLWKAGEWRKLMHPAHFIGLLVAIGLVLLWWLPYSERTGGAGGAMVHQLTDRIDGSDFDLRGWLLNIPRGLANLLPWALFLIVGWVPLHSDTPEKIRALISGLRWAVVTSFLVVSVAPGSLPRYTMPVTVPFALWIALQLRWGIMPERLWRIWRTVTGGGVGQLKTLSLRTGVLMVLLMAIYSWAVVPKLEERSLWRAAGTKINAAVQPGETVYAVDPGSQPIFFYLSVPYQFVDKAKRLPANARYVLAREKPLADVRKLHPEAREILRYEDRGQKTTVLLELDRRN
ncbi:MAG TPA: glycosyltransferase family 39 protein [Tepidisphaeraceae bacterium]